jgi:DNA-binding GntR family transcriptional regulator
VAEHEEMMAALLKRDAAALSEVIGRHMDATLVRVREVL